MKKLNRVWMTALVACFLGLSVSAQATPLAGTELVTFEIQVVPEGETVLSTTVLERIPQGSGYTYSITRTMVENPSGNNPNPSDPATWTVLTYEGTVTFLSSATPPIDTFFLALTSLRQGWLRSGACPHPRSRVPRTARSTRARRSLSVR